jgi:hypothetical protein
MSEQLVADPATYTTHQKKTYIHAFSGVRTRDLNIPAAADRRLRPHGHLYSKEHNIWTWTAQELISVGGGGWLEMPFQCTLSLMHRGWMISETRLEITEEKFRMAYFVWKDWGRPYNLQTGELVSNRKENQKKKTKRKIFVICTLCLIQWLKRGMWGKGR